MTESRFRERRSAFRDESTSDTEAPPAPAEAASTASLGGGYSAGAASAGIEAAGAAACGYGIIDGNGIPHAGNRDAAAQSARTGLAHGAAETTAGARATLAGGGVNRAAGAAIGVDDAGYGDGAGGLRGEHATEISTAAIPDGAALAAYRHRSGTAITTVARLAGLAAARAAD